MVSMDQFYPELAAACGRVLSTKSQEELNRLSGFMNENLRDHIVTHAQRAELHREYTRLVNERVDLTDPDVLRSISIQILPIVIFVILAEAVAEAGQKIQRDRETDVLVGRHAHYLARLIAG